MIEPIVTYDSGFLDINLDGVHYFARVKDESVQHKDMDWLCGRIENAIRRWTEGKPELQDGLWEGGRLTKVVSGSDIRNAVLEGCNVEFSGPVRLSRYSKSLYVNSGRDRDEKFLAVDLVGAKYILPAPEGTVSVSLVGLIYKVVSFAYFKDYDVCEDLFALPVVLINGKPELLCDLYFVQPLKDPETGVSLLHSGIYSGVMPLVDAMDYYLTIKSFLDGYLEEDPVQRMFRSRVGKGISFDDYKATLAALGVTVIENAEKAI